MVNNETRRLDRPRRKEPKTALRAAGRALAESRKLAAAGQFTKATRAAQLAERHAKLALQLVSLDASLKRITAARHRALAAIASALVEAETKVAPKSNFALGPDTDPADMTRNWSIRDPRVQALFKQAMEKGEAG